MSAAPFNLESCLDEPVLRRRLEFVRDMHRIQHSHGNFNYSRYMHGMAVGLELALATMEGRDPVFCQAPREYLEALSLAPHAYPGECAPTTNPGVLQVGHAVITGQSEATYPTPNA